MLKQSLQLITIALTMGLCGCAAIKTPEKEFQQILDEHAIPLAISSGQIVQGNDAALQSKLALINRAQNTIDMAYYIFADDPSTAVITDALLKATKRGVKVRILLDYFVNYRHFARLSRLESIAEQHAGSLTFHLFNAPDQQIILDAIYMTLGCGEAGPGTKTQRLSCSEEKLNTIETLIQSKADKASTYGSRLLLAGLYGRSAPLMQMALMSSIDNALEELSRLNVQQGGGASPEQIKRIGRIYFEAKFSGGLNKLVNQIQLSSLSLLYGDQLEPYFSALSDFLPVSRKRSGKDSLPWRHMTDFLHHKLLLVDSEAFQLGGRNLEDAYHTQPYSSSGKYTFIDTDVMVTLSNKSDGMKQRFDTLWHFTPMVASLDEVRQQTDTQALIAYQQTESVCDTDSCIRDIFEQKLTVSSDMLAAALDNRRAEMLARYEQYKQAHLRSVQQKISLSENARLYYLENIPFSPTNKDSRQFGAKHGKESESGKHIHQLWLTAIDKVCDDAVKGEARNIVMHNAYVMLPANLLKKIAETMDGRVPCPDVELIIITNSMETTDLNLVNLFANHQLKALGEYQQAQTNKNGIRFRYLEHQFTGDASSHLSLHSKVMILGDDMFIGSANADVRSLMMDTNNGLFISRSPASTAGYQKWLQGLINKGHIAPPKVNVINESRESLLLRDMAFLDTMISKYQVQQWLSRQQSQQLKNKFRTLLDETYILSRDIISKGGDADAAAKRFNALFKTI